MKNTNDINNDSIKNDDNIDSKNDLNNDDIKNDSNNDSNIE